MAQYYSAKPQWYTVQITDWSGTSEEDFLAYNHNDAVRLCREYMALHGRTRHDGPVKYRPRRKKGYCDY
jgi:hypothetical protein